MTSSDPTTDHVLLLCDDRPRGERLSRWIAGAGHDVVALAGYALAAPPSADDFQARVRLAAEVGRLLRELARHATRDALTGLDNRRYLLLRLDQEFARARRYRTPLSLAVFDVDRLKEVNDRHGLAAGDAVIRRVGEVIRTQVRREDVMGHMGDDVFGIVLPGNSYRGAAILANKIRTEVEEAAVPAVATELAIRLSCGISTYPDNRTIETADDLVAAAETALGQAKSRGGNRVFIDEGVLLKERPIVLVIDADAHLLDLAEDLLSLDEFSVLTAGDPRTALEVLRSRRPDVLVLDLGMVDDDVPLVERLEREFTGKRLPIIGLFCDPNADPERFVRLGVDRYITKPFSVGLLRGAVRELLTSYRRGSENVRPRR